MNATSSTVLSARPGTDPVFGSLGGLFRTTLRSVQMQWFLYRAERRKVQPIVTLCEMNPHMLRDIGAPDEMIACASATRPAYQRHGIPFGLAVLFAAIGLAGMGTPTSAATVAHAAASSKAQANVQPVSEPMAAVFAGEYVNGAPVYRFPAIVVTSSRKADASGNLPPCRQARATPAKTRA